MARLNNFTKKQLIEVFSLMVTARELDLKMLILLKAFTMSTAEMNKVLKLKKKPLASQKEPRIAYPIGVTK